ncbi:MAG TPA: DUF2851 family protein [Patescibacteria group bacterium]|nr:DUF2851 family protein [Patescibacteria group bacterium]
MSFIQDSFYSRWRIQSGLVILHENTDSPPERLLQTIWQHQRLLRDQLTTLDGQPVRVLHPGFHNVEGGPDFRRAVVQFGEETPRQGDVEVDLRSSGWRSHGHDVNPAFRNVVLHVVWESERAAAGAPPLICIRHVLDSPLGELSLWLGGEAAPGFPEMLRGDCCAPLRKLSSHRLIELLHQAAHVRLRSKAALFQARARQVGWEQSLWEGLFRALGYKHNVWPMQRLGELRPRWLIAGNKSLSLQARLLGLSGLLPAELAGRPNDNRSYLRQIWDQWWRERDSFADVILPRVAWRLHGLRPANHPERRLALAAGWSTVGPLAASLQQWCAADLKQKQMCSALCADFQVAPDDFWSWHWTLRSPRLKKRQPWLGETRVADLAMNVVIPWLWTRAAEGKSHTVQQRLEDRYFHWPPAEDNSILRLARQRLLGSADTAWLPGAAAQQGLLQLVRDFCDQSDSLCRQCKLPSLVKEFATLK